MHPSFRLPLRRSLVGVLLLSLLTLPGVFAQTYVQKTGTANPFNGIDVEFYSRLALGDLDADGDGDAIIGEHNGGINYFENVVPLTITQQPTPSSLTVCQGGLASGTVAATGEGTLAYQWYKGAASTSTGTLVAGQNTATLSLSNVQPADAGNYYTRVSNADGVVWSTAFTLTVAPTTAIQSITPSQGTCPGQAFTLSVQSDLPVVSPEHLRCPTCTFLPNGLITN